MYTIRNLYDLNHTLAEAYLSQFTYPWEALKGIKAFITELGPQLGEDYTELAPQVWVHKTAVVAPTAFLGAPCIIGSSTEVRHGAFIRSCALVGEGCVVGNSVELKNVILFDKVQVPHYNYVGDSILGYKAHMGAGSTFCQMRNPGIPTKINKPFKISVVSRFKRVERGPSSKSAITTRVITRWCCSTL